jgi:hypothetical protein
MKTRCALLMALVITGCAEPKTSTYKQADGAQAPGGGELAFRMPSNGQDFREIASSVELKNTTFVASNKQGQDGEAAAKKSASIDRKIIYNADVHRVIDNFENGEAQLKQLIATHQGQIASSDMRGQSGSQRTGHWKVRIPIANFEAFKAATEKVGNLERSSINSSDVTEEFFDIEARLNNKKVEEKRLIQHLEKSTAKLSDILEVEKELSRVRAEIEQMQGRLNLLKNLTSLTTIDVHLREVKNYVPPTSPTYGDDVSRAFSFSWDSLVRTGRVISLNLISVLPWLPLWIILALVLYRPIRWSWRQVRDGFKQPEPLVTQA